MSKPFTIIILLAAAAGLLGAGLWFSGSWPVACTTRGCVTQAAWDRLHTLQARFAQAVGEKEPSEVDSLTTLVRQHLVRQAGLRSSSTLADARRYREEILNLKEENLLAETVGLTLDEYDEAVVLPFLQQEALKQHMSVESIEELYQQLSNERWIVILPVGLKWDRGSGTVVAR